MAKKFIFVNVDGDYEETPNAYEASDFVNTGGSGNAGKPGSGPGHPVACPQNDPS